MSIAVVAATLLTVAALTPQQKASLLVVSGLPAPARVGGVIVHRYNRWDARPRGALVFVDREGGETRAFPELPPARAAAAYVKSADAFTAGRATGVALRRARVDVDLAPVLDLASGALGRRHFRRPALGIAFARGLAAWRTAGCAKHFPGLGSARFSTDDRPHVDAVLRARELAGFRGAVAAGIPCVMVGHAFYRSLGRRRASLEPATYRLLRGMGFDGVAITDSLSIVRRPPADWPVRSARAGADLLLVPSPRQAARAIRALVPLARRGELDRHVQRALLFRSRLGR